MRREDRLTPLWRSEWSDETRDLIDGLAGEMAKVEGEYHDENPDGDASGTVNIVCTMAHNPAVMAPFLRFAAALSLYGTLSRREHELLALRAILHCRSAFEWGHHVVFALAAGLSEEEIARVVEGPDHPDWSDDDRLLMRVADELQGDCDLRPETWAALRARYSDAQLVEIPFVVGQYTMLSMVANATGVPIEKGLRPLPEAKGAR